MFPAVLVHFNDALKSFSGMAAEEERRSWGESGEDDEARGRMLEKQEEARGRKMENEEEKQEETSGRKEDMGKKQEETRRAAVRWR